MIEDWENLGEWLQKDEWVWPEDEYPNPDYRLCEAPEDLDRYFINHGASMNEASMNEAVVSRPLLGVDTESDNGTPYSIQISSKPGTARMVLASNRQLLQQLGWHISQYMWVYHQAGADMWIEKPLMMPGHVFQDTMREAYNLHLPQGLKELSFRQFGTRMQSWEDLVTGPSRQALTGWLVERIMEEQDRPIVQEVQLKTKVKRVSKPNSWEKMYQHALKHMESDSYDPWKYLDERLDARVTMPRKSIVHAPIEDQVRYACRDADLTLRNALKFEEIRRSIVAGGGQWYVDPSDWDR
jgi:hypothetical protein